MINPPGANKIIFVKLTSLIVSNDSIKDNPVSDAPTTTIRELFETLVLDNYFLVNMAKENGAYS